MKRSNLSKRQLERNEAGLKQMLFVIVHKYHKGAITITTEEMMEELSLIEKTKIDAGPKGIEITTTDKYMQIRKEDLKNGTTIGEKETE